MTTTVDVATQVAPEYLINEKKSLAWITGLATHPTSLVIRGVEYELTKKNCILMLEKYKKQEIVFHGEFKEFVVWWFVRVYREHPELFQSTDAPRLSYTIPEVSPRTQKGKGIGYIQKSSGGLETSTFGILQGNEDTDVKVLEAIFKMFKGSDIFARPCPKVPRHGFVDSRTVKDETEATSVLQETLSVDNEGELVLMPKIDATHNFVVTPSSITIGKGHDGATVGIATKTYPLTGKWLDHFTKPYPGIHEPDVPYLEIVHDGKRSVLVQMRGGPEVPRSANYIPQTVTVQRIVKAEGDLLEWETRMREIKGVDGVVVDHTGGSLTSHYAVHAQLNHIPVFCTITPEVGKTYKQTSSKIRYNWAHVIRGLMHSLLLTHSEAKMSQTRKRVGGMIYATQYASLMGSEAGFYVGHAVGTMLSLGIAACGGEWRHLAGSHFAGKSRQYVYAELTKDYLKAREKHPTFAHSFAYDKWGSNYGGKKWYDCADAIIQLDTAMLAFVKSPGEKTFQDMIMCLNRAINCAHNNGWWFNKYVSESVFSDITDERLPAIVEAVLYMYSVPPKKGLSQKAKALLEALRAAEPMQVKAPKKVLSTISKAQFRLLQENPHPTTAQEIVSDHIRVQYYVGDTSVEKNLVANSVDALQKAWGENPVYLLSYVSSLQAYRPLTLEQSSKGWIASLNGIPIVTIPVDYTYESEE